MHCVPLTIRWDIASSIVFSVVAPLSAGGVFWGPRCVRRGRRHAALGPRGRVCDAVQVAQRAGTMDCGAARVPCGGAEVTRHVT